MRSSSAETAWMAPSAERTLHEEGIEEIADRFTPATHGQSLKHLGDEYEQVMIKAVRTGQLQQPR